MWSGEKPGIQGPRFCSCRGPRHCSWPVTMGLCFLLSEGVELKELMFSTGLESSSCVVFVYGSWIYLNSSHRQEFLPLGGSGWSMSVAVSCHRPEWPSPTCCCPLELQPRPRPTSYCRLPGCGLLRIGKEPWLWLRLLKCVAWRRVQENSRLNCQISLGT